MDNETKAKEWVRNNDLTANKLSNAIESAIEYIDGETQMYMGEDYQHEVCLEIIADSSVGTYMPEYIADYLDLSIPDGAKDPDGNPTTDWRDYEWSWEDIESFAQAVSDELNKILGELNERDGTFYFGTIEDIGDYALFYSWDE